MSTEIPETDPVGALRRKVIAARHVGVGARCPCGEDRPEALIAGSNPPHAPLANGRAMGRTAIDQHHFAGRANNPATIPSSR